MKRRDTVSSMEMAGSTPGFTAKYVPETSGELNFIKKLSVIFGFSILGILIYTIISSPMLVTVTGVGEVDVPATNATISFTLASAVEGSPGAAINSVNSKATTLRTFLVNSGIAESDISESVVTAVPMSLISPGATGYQATISMSAKTVHVNDLSGLISNLYSQGAQVVGRPLLSVENQEDLDKDAVNLATKDADRQAKRIGSAKWRFIRRVVGVSQVSSGTTSTSTSKPDVVTGVNDPVAAANGVFKIVKSVSVTYKMW